MSVITIENLVRDYGGGKGVFDISFYVNPGEAQPCFLQVPLCCMYWELWYLKEKIYRFK